MTESRKAIRAQIARELTARRDELQAALGSLSNVLLSQGFIVVNAAGVPLKFDVAGQQVSNPVSAGMPHLATRFTHQDAENVAELVIDGNGDRAHAVHVTEAIKNDIWHLGLVMAMFDGPN